jgi:hypothetical protein
MDPNSSFEGRSFSSARSNEPRRGNGAASLTGLMLIGD